MKKLNNPKLTLKKKTITKLNDSQLRHLLGGDDEKTVENNIDGERCTRGCPPGM